jgi:KDO2-lipid IV(A) lauroyltransferase
MQRFFQSSLGVNLGLTLGRLFPPTLGYQISEFVARRLARRTDSPLVRAVRANQIVIREKNTSPEILDQAIDEVLIHAGRCFIDLYHNLQNPPGLKGLSPLNPLLESLIAQSHAGSLGTFIVAPHLSNFDLVLLAAAYRGLKAQVLTYGNPTGGYKIQNDIRSQTGLNITPVSPEVHNQAIENLHAGGFVITAVDRPIRKKTHYMNFFGYQSPLPVGHIRMALETNVPIIVVAAEWKTDELYHLNISDPIELVRHADPDQEIRINGEVVLKEIERFIRAAPTQWLMYYPVWPERSGNEDL